jgi:hypothetical protein
MRSYGPIFVTPAVRLFGSLQTPPNNTLNDRLIIPEVSRD